MTDENQPQYCAREAAALVGLELEWAVGDGRLSGLAMDGGISAGVQRGVVSLQRGGVISKRRGLVSVCSQMPVCCCVTCECEYLHSRVTTPARAKYLLWATGLVATNCQQRNATDCLRTKLNLIQKFPICYLGHNCIEKAELLVWFVFRKL